ncbi:EscU/YscU/HrcU family type III secretion system export apparatus switch protein [Sulfidibacter corallicola]|uniref:EscU/YscU/HrcU family type III secretion system export apparatus switch protein n=1 Tax=Sulfidibacter corallicola TaxID=2818388 RepID=A0A8A4TDN9_SULCO|nr:EscU/YscU/HrcU family type III secretion system export apparatus switch protein [Sulfidibacter corallicola]QTD48209.1 EscU/YscU/HrcU family type III secretion system export apparatus switch protein [Sulfidibacter corallicola]
MDRPPRKPTKAVGLKYEHGKDAKPYVVSRGQGVIAEEILRAARENQVPIKQDSGLVETLLKLDYMQEIPEELFMMVAEVLVFAYEALGKDID